MKSRIFICAGILFLFLCLSCNSESGKLPSKDFTITTQSGNSLGVKAEIADTYQTRQHGFMERENIPEGTGMLFVFEKDQVLSFWMKNTPTPLSIAYIDQSGKIRDIFDMTPFSLANVTSTVSVRYALEVPQGWFDRNGIKTGDYIDLSPVK